MSEKMFDSADWYDRTTNWGARLRREIPVLVDVFGPAGAGGVLDAGCGNGRQAIALSQQGYTVVGADASADMLRFAKALALSAGAKLRFEQAPYANLRKTCGTGFDGVYCIGNALAAAGSAEDVATAIAQFAACLRTGGRLFVQILNFAAMRERVPCVQGPRTAIVDGQEYVSVRQFHFHERSAQVTNITLWKAPEWQHRAHCGRLYPIERDEFETHCARAGLHVDAMWGSYAREPFDARSSVDLIAVATRA